jgi:lipid-binding SYLF domain-containing protein
MERIYPNSFGRSALLFAVLVTLGFGSHVFAADSGHLDSDAKAALEELYNKVPGTRSMSEQAKAVLIFPNIVKAGFIIGAEYGTGVLMKGGEPAGYYNIAAASYGLQAGVQGYAYAMFLMTDDAVNYLDSSSGWEIGVGPSIVVLDAGAAETVTTTTAKSDVYAVVFGQKGLMAGLGLQGSKISRTSP